MPFALASVTLVEINGVGLLHIRVPIPWRLTITLEKKLLGRTGIATRTNTGDIPGFLAVLSLRGFPLLVVE
jgi:hypothetical protein